MSRQLLNKRGKHSLYPRCLFEQPFVVGFVQEIRIGRKDNMTVQFTDRDELFLKNRANSGNPLLPQP
jgi:hypothetical protein